MAGKQVVQLRVLEERELKEIMEEQTYLSLVLFAVHTVSFQNSVLSVQ